MKRTLQLFSLAMIVSLLMSAVGLPLLPVQAAIAGTWGYVGLASISPGPASYTSLRFDSGTPYVAFQDAINSDKASVMKFNGTNWVNVGPAGFSAGGAHALAFAVNNGTPYVAFANSNNSYKSDVMKFNGATWVNVGSADFSNVGISKLSLA